jgi:hypothetical protein
MNVILTQTLGPSKIKPVNMQKSIYIRDEHELRNESSPVPNPIAPGPPANIG